MSTLVRGAKNAFRNTVRTFSVVFILAISIGLALVMFLAYRSVSDRIETVKATIGNTITVNPAGAQGFLGGGEPLTESQMNDIKMLEHVTKVTATLSVRMSQDTDTSLKSAVEPGTLGNRQIQFNRRDANGPQAGVTQIQPQQVAAFALPIMGTGITDTSIVSTGTSTLTSGEVFTAETTDNVAVVGKSLAEKNSLAVGSTFTAFDETVKVVGIYDAGNQFANSSFYLPLALAQKLSDQESEVTNITVSVDSITNLDTTVAAIKSKLGSDKADVTSNEESSKQAVAPLENVKAISLYSLIGALVAGAVITLLTMMMIVRERRKEIGVLKAIGASNGTVVTQFVSESMVLTFLGSLVGVILGTFLSNPILQALVSSSTSQATSGPQFSAAGGPVAGGAMRIVQFGGNIQANIRDIQAVVGYEILLYGLLVAVAIAILGSAIPAWLIAKVRPAEVIRGE